MKKENVSNKIFHECNGHSMCCLESYFGEHSSCVPQP